MELKGLLHSLQFTVSGQQILSLALQGDFRPYYDNLQGKELNIKITQFRQKRSLNANAYVWVLINKLAEVTGLSPKEVYRNAIRNIGGVSETVCCQNKGVDRFCKSWEKNGIGWQTEIIDSKIDGCTNILCYYGSSEYDTQQMSRLIDNVVQDCKAVGIETMTPAELARICEEWQ